MGIVRLRRARMQAPVAVSRAYRATIAPAAPTGVPGSPTMNQAIACEKSKYGRLVERGFGGWFWDAYRLAAVAKGDADVSRKAVRRRTTERSRL